MKEINILPLLFEKKGQALCERFFSFHERLPKFLAKSILKEIPGFLSCCPYPFLEVCDPYLLAKIFLCYVRFSQTNFSTIPKHIRLKIFEISASTYGLMGGIEYHEFLQEERIIKCMQRLIPATKPVLLSFLSFKQKPIQIFYIEFIKMRGGKFSSEEKEKIYRELPAILQKELETKAFFFPGNEEEVFKNIHLLRRELKDKQDIPQVMISFMEYFRDSLKFLVVVLRIAEAGTPSIHLLSKRLSSLIHFSLESVFSLERINRKYFKEANVFTLEVDCTKFLRTNNTINLKTVRHYVAKELETMLGFFRDYNGGLLDKENQQLNATKSLLEKRGISLPFLEDFFCNLKPITLRAIIFPKTGLEFALLFNKLFEVELRAKQKYCLESHFSSDVHIVVIKTKEKEWKTTFPQKIFAEIQNCGSSYLDVDRHTYLVFFQQFPADKSLINLIRHELCNLTSLQIEHDASVLRLNFQGGDPPTLNPRFAYDINCHILANLLFEGLTQFTDEGKVIPAAAKTIEISPCQLHYTFTLRNALWSNGEEVTAYHFERAWKKALLAESESRLYLNFFSYLKNAEKIISKQLPISEIGVFAKDAKTLCVELEYPCPHFLNLVATPSFFPLFGESQEPEDFNGPFTLSEWKQDSLLYLSKNPFYHDATSVSLRGIKISMVQDPYVAYRMFKKGQLDLIGDPISPLPQKILTNPNSQEELLTKRVSRIYWIHCNLNNYPLHNTHLRRALSLSLNRQQITERVFIKQSPHHSPLPIRYAAQANSLDTQEEAQAYFKKALEELNLTPETFPPLVLSHSDLSFDISLFQELKEQWKQTLGLTLISKPLCWGEFSSSLEKRNYQLGGLFRRDFYYNPLFYLNFFKSSRYNPHTWDDPEYERLLNECLKFPEDEKAINQMEQFLIEKSPVIPLVSQNYLYLMHKRVRGLKINENGCLNFRETSIEENY